MFAIIGQCNLDIRHRRIKCSDSQGNVATGYKQAVAMVAKVNNWTEVYAAKVTSYHIQKIKEEYYGNNRKSKG